MFVKMFDRNFEVMLSSLMIKIITIIQHKEELAKMYWKSGWGTLSKIVQHKEELPEIFSAQTGSGTHKFSQGLANSFASHVKKLAAPFRQSEQKVGCFVATREDVVSWVQSRLASSAATA